MRSFTPSLRRTAVLLAIVVSLGLLLALAQPQIRQALRKAFVGTPASPNPGAAARQTSRLAPPPVPVMVDLMKPGTGLRYTPPLRSLAESGGEREREDGDADLPVILRGRVDKDDYNRLRAEQIYAWRGMDINLPFDGRSRNAAIQRQTDSRRIFAPLVCKFNAQFFFGIFWQPVDECGKIIIQIA